MPELPEVRAAAKRLDSAATGKTVAAVKTFHPALRRKLSPQRARVAVGQRIVSVERQGKHQLLHLAKGDTIVIHFEKGDTRFKGIYQAINKHFLAAQENRFTFVNREQDLGDEGLRKAKLSYNPVTFMQKYDVEFV